MTWQAFIYVCAILLLLTALMFGLQPGRIRIKSRHNRESDRLLSLSPEVSRKLVHVIMGLVALTFPWLFADLLPVIIVTAFSFAFLAALRWNIRLGALTGGVLRRVDRKTSGELYFPIAIATVYWLSDGAAVPYTCSILCLALADVAASLIGARFGTHRFRVWKGTKSIEGSVAFLAVAFAAVITVLLISGIDSFRAVSIALNVAVATTLLEALSARGSDNLTVPLAAVLLLTMSLP